MPDSVVANPLPDDITPDQKEKFLALMAHYCDILADNIGHTGVLQHHIDTGNAIPSQEGPSYKARNCTQFTAGDVV